MLSTASGWLGAEGARPPTSWLLVHAVAALLCVLKTHRNPTSAEIGESLTPKGFLRIGIPVPHSQNAENNTSLFASVLVA